MDRIISVLVIGMLVAVPVEAQKPHVQVIFDVAEADYVDLFTPTALDSLKEEAARLIADTLGNRLPVLEVTTTPADYQLVITVDRQDNLGVSPLQLDRGLYAQLVGPDSSTSRSWWTLFRGGGSTGEGLVGEGVPVRQAFLGQLRLALMDADFDDLVQVHLSRVPIARTARPLDLPEPDGFGWVAAGPQDSLCLAVGNMLRVLVLLPTRLDTVPLNRLYEAKVASTFNAKQVFGDPLPQDWRDMAVGVFARPEPPNQPDIAFVQQDTSVIVAGIFLLRYRPAGRDLCKPLLTPAEAEARPGGGT